MEKNTKIVFWIVAVFVLLIVISIVASSKSGVLFSPPSGKGKPGDGGGGGKPKAECADKIDNDGDGFTDLSDSGCANKKDKDESNCGDGVCEGGETSSNCLVDCGVADSCSDTDGGNILETFGTVSGYLNNQQYSDDDYCASTSNIVEYYCSGSYKNSQTQSCGTDTYGDEYCQGDSVYKDFIDYSCSNGVCGNTITPQVQSNCNDLDGNYGGSYCTNGIAYNEIRDYSCGSGSCTYTTTYEQSVVCDDFDGYAGPTWCSGNLIYREYLDYSCGDPACTYTSSDQQVNDCDNYDGYIGFNYCLGGNVVKDYRDYSCSGGGCDYTDNATLQETCTNGCTNGVCDGAPADSCGDTDGGFSIFTQGTVSGYNNGNSYSHTDYCVGIALIEYYCSGTQWYTSNQNCTGNTTTGCSSGACY